VHAAYAWLVGTAGSGNPMRPIGLPIRQWLIAVASALVLFLPWIIVLINGMDSAETYTAWMERAIGAQQNLLSWARHILLALLDIGPTNKPPAWSLLLLLPLAAAVAHFLWKAPRPQQALLWLIALAYIGIVLGPDLLLGGIRSNHIRYGLPAVLAIQLMVAWSIGRTVLRGGNAGIIASAGLLVLVAFGGWSQWRIQQAESWWNKQYSARNIEVARIINGLQRPLVAVSPHGVTLGELISLAHHLDDQVRIWSQHEYGVPIQLPPGFDAIVMLTPNSEVRDAVAPERKVEPLLDTWQWFIAKQARGPESASTEQTPGITRPAP
jgi:uncharacterized membrane protein